MSGYLGHGKIQAAERKKVYLELILNNENLKPEADCSAGWFGIILMIQVQIFLEITNIDRGPAHE